jgi:orotidine-5'-phosphate decarboxylase
MTELIVALDAPWMCPPRVADYRYAGVRWVKIGAQNIDRAWHFIASSRKRGVSDVSLFLDLKLADTRDTVEAAVRRFADLGVASISTYTKSATEAALRGAEGSPLLVWQVAALTDGTDRHMPIDIAHGVICPVSDASRWSVSRPVICPGVRRATDAADGHTYTATPREAVAAGARWVVVGRPIWAADDPIAAARAFIEELR